MIGKSRGDESRNAHAELAITITPAQSVTCYCMDVSLSVLGTHRAETRPAPARSVEVAIRVRWRYVRTVGGAADTFVISSSASTEWA